ncbi:ZTP29, partial [Symbiodinium microadriaticum]
MQWAFFCFRRLDRVYNLPPGPRKPEPKQPPLVLTLRFWAFVPKLQLVGWSEQVKDKVSGFKQRLVKVGTCQRCSRLRHRADGSDTVSMISELSTVSTFPEMAPQAELLQALKATAIVRSLVAGLSTSVGAAIVLLLRTSPTASQMAFALALAAGVMLTVSFVEMFLPPFIQAGSRFQACASGSLGFLSFLLIRKVLPEPDLGLGKKDGDGGDPETDHVSEAAVPTKARQWRLAFLMMLALTAHNFPEGMAVGVSSLQSTHLGVVVMAAIAVHNIPEGIAIALPVLEATNSLSLAVLLATLSGLAEPLGAFIAVSILPRGALAGSGMDILLCVVGGIMSSVACFELLPEALAQGQNWSTVAGLIVGMMDSCLKPYLYVFFRSYPPQTRGIDYGAKLTGRLVVVKNRLPPSLEDLQPEKLLTEEVGKKQKQESREMYKKARVKQSNLQKARAEVDKFLQQHAIYSDSFDANVAKVNMCNVGPKFPHVSNANQCQGLIAATTRGLTPALFSALCRLGYRLSGEAVPGSAQVLKPGDFAFLLITVDMIAKEPLLEVIMRRGNLQLMASHPGESIHEVFLLCILLGQQSGRGDRLMNTLHEDLPLLIKTAELRQVLRELPPLQAAMELGDMASLDLELSKWRGEDYGHVGRVECLNVNMAKERLLTWRGVDHTWKEVIREVERMPSSLSSLTNQCQRLFRAMKEAQLTKPRAKFCGPTLNFQELGIDVSFAMLELRSSLVSRFTDSAEAFIQQLSEVELHHARSLPHVALLEEKGLPLAQQFRYFALMEAVRYNAFDIPSSMLSNLRLSSDRHEEANATSEPDLNISKAFGNETAPKPFQPQELPAYHPSPGTAMGSACSLNEDETELKGAVKSRVQLRPDHRRPVKPRSEMGPPELLEASLLGDMKQAGWVLETDGNAHGVPTCTGWLPLHVSAAQGHLDIARALLRRKAEVNPPSDSLSAISPLSLACLSGQASLVQLLLCAAATIDGPEGHGGAPLLHAAYKNFASICEILLDSGANPHVAFTKSGHTQLEIPTAKTPLHDDHWHRILCEPSQGGTSLQQLRTEGVTALHLAAWHGSARTCWALLEASARPDARDCLHRSALMLSAERGHLEVVRLLLERRAHLHPSLHGHTAASLAARANQTAAIELLLEGKVDVDYVAWFGAPTMLHIAAYWRYQGLVSKLLTLK